MKHLILGNGGAGVAAAKKLRELNPDDEITIVSNEPYPAYSRCLLADYIAGTVPKEKLFIYPEGFYQKNRFNLLLNVQAVDIDTDKRTVIFKSGKSLEFDKLLIATGASPLLPPIQGVESEKAVGLRTIADADKLIELASDSDRCAVIGGGYIGLETAHALRAGESRGALARLDVYVLEMMPHILYANFDQPSAQIITNDFKSAGIAIRTEDEGRVVRIDEFEDKLKLILGSGEHIEVDFAVYATGVRSNTEFVSETPIRVDVGILVDKHLETNVEGIYAAGDVAQAKALLTGEPQTTPIWPNAVAQGKLAAYNMAGLERIYTGEVGLQNAVEFREVPAIAFGLSKITESNGYQVKRIYNPARVIYRKIVLQEDVVRGMIFVGDISNSGIVTNLIKSGTHLGKLKDRILDKTFSMAYLIEEKLPEIDLYI